MKKKQFIQDIEYEFPYHYIPSFREGFNQTYNWSWGRNYVSTIEFLLTEVKKDSKEIKSIVDVGCGDGRITKELVLDFGDKYVVGIDYSKRAINLAKALNPNINFLNKDIINGAISNKFDAITLVEVFEHIPKEVCNNFVIGLLNLLNNEGKIYLTVPHQNKPVSAKHFQHFSYNSLIAYFEEFFLVEKVVYFDKLSVWNTLLNRIFVNKLFILNNRMINNMLYKLYKKYFFFAKEDNCGRIYLKLKKK